MIIANILKKQNSEFPKVTLLLLASCLVTTLPQVFLGDLYSRMTGSPFRYHLGWAPTISFFSHSPDMLLQHLGGNLMVLVTMGLLIEVILGSNTFACITTIAFATTMVFQLLSGLNSFHGASGIFWAYHLVVFFFLVVFLEEFGIKRLFQEAYVYLFSTLVIFDFVGINLIEVFVQKRQFLENSGQVLHLVSLLSIVPYMMIKRTNLQTMSVRYFRGANNHPDRRKGWVLLIALLFVFNLLGTTVALYETIQTNTVSYTVSRGHDTTQSPKVNLVVEFSEDMIRGSEQLADYSVTSLDEKILWEAHWTSSRVLLVELSRLPEPKESVYLVYRVTTQSGREKEVVVRQ